MAGSVIYTLHTKIELGGGHKPKYPQLGGIIKNESTGHLYGNIEMVPYKGWDGRFYLFIPKKQAEKLAQEQQADNPVNTEEAPW